MNFKVIFCSLFIVLLLLTAFQTPTSVNYAILSGEIKNPISDTLQLLNNKSKPIHTIILDGKNTFRDTITISEGYFKLTNGEEIVPLYLKPSFNLHLFLDNKLFAKSIKYEGQGAVENNYLAQKNFLEEGFGELNYYAYYTELEEKEFLDLADSIHQVKMDYLATKNKVDRNFKLLETQFLRYQYLGKIAEYEEIYGYLRKDKDFKLSPNFPDVFADVSFENEQLLGFPFYMRFLENYLNRINNNKLKEDKDIDYILIKLSTIEEKISNATIREELAYQIGQYGLRETKQLEASYEKLQLLIQKEDYLKLIKENYTAMKKLAKGAIAPGFELENEKGELISLESLKDNYVYIDIWATWCGPCIKEMVELKKTQQIFTNKPIKFVSICYKDTEEKWRQVLDEKELTGIQLFAPNANIPFLKYYGAGGIPQFILLDKQGKILDANALPPSNPSLEKMLMELVN